MMHLAVLISYQLSKCDSLVGEKTLYAAVSCGGLRWVAVMAHFNDGIFKTSSVR